MRFTDPTVPELDYTNWRWGRALIPDRTGVSTFVISGRETIAFGPLQQTLDIAAAASGWSGVIATANPYLKSALRQLGFAETVLS